MIEPSLTWPPKPLSLFDGDSGFCRQWVRRWHRITGDRVEHRTSHEERRGSLEIGPDGFRAKIRWSS